MSGRRLSMISVLVVLAASSALIGRAESADALTFKSYSTYLGPGPPGARPMASGARELPRPSLPASRPTRPTPPTPPQLQALLNQWWGGLENEHGSHFLLPAHAGRHRLDRRPARAAQSMAERDRGLEGQPLPPRATRAADASAPTKTGSFSLKPNTPTVAVGERVELRDRLEGAAARTTGTT